MIRDKFWHIIAILGLLLWGAALQAQTKKPAAGSLTVKEDMSAKKDAQPAAEPVKTDWLEKLQIKVGLNAGLGLFLGEVGQRVGLGYNLNLWADATPPMNLPLPAMLELRGGLSFGYGGNSGTASGNSHTLSYIPMLVYARGVYKDLPIPLRPYATLGTGVSMASWEGKSSDGSVTESVSAAHGTLLFGLGAGYAVDAAQKIEIMADINFLIMFGTASATNMQFNLGAGYRI